MKIWIDLTNAPHIAFFIPIIKVLESKKHEVIITMRDFNQTVELAKYYGIKGTAIGKHGGKSNIGKIIKLITRSFALSRFIKKKKVDIAVSHNSYTQILAAKLCHLRTITLMDYEGQPANHIAFRLADKIIVPDCFPEKALKKFGAKKGKIFKYNGFKEQIYLSDFCANQKFDQEIKKACNLDPGWDLSKKIVVTVRTPAIQAAYHPFENKLFDILLERLNQAKDITTFVFARYDYQRKIIKNMYPNVIVPNAPLDGKNLIYYSDMVISAGGTMNREAAILGTPAYTIFAGDIPAVDNKLIELGCLSAIHKEADIHKLRFEKKIASKKYINTGLCEYIVDEII